MFDLHSDKHVSADRQVAAAAFCVDRAVFGHRFLSTLIDIVGLDAGTLNSGGLDA